MRPLSCFSRRIASIVVLCLSAVGLEAGTQSTRSSDRTGVLLLAHGGRPAWNSTVASLAADVDREYPTEVAFGMASKPAIVKAIDRLLARGVTRIRAVPLFVSSYSSVITSTEYLLGLRAEAPADLATFARMTHGPGGEHATHQTNGAPDLTPIAARVPITMSRALDDNPIVSEILTARALAISRTPEKEVAILVAHGPVPEDDNQRWLGVLKTLADRIAARAAFARIEYQTVRDDAPAPIRDQATAELRARIERATAEGNRVLVVPVLLSWGGIEAGIRKRLTGLTYTMSEAALAPDTRLVQWVLKSVTGS